MKPVTAEERLRGSTTRRAAPSAARDLPPDAPYRRADVARRIADLIRSDLHAGRLNEQLPYEWDLLRRYNASRGATREALRLLSDQGVLRRLPGVGTLRRVDRTAIRMHQAAAAIHIVDADTMDADEIGGARMQAETITHERLAAPVAVAEALEMPVGEDVLFTEALIRIDGTPHRLRSSWIPVSRVPGMNHDSVTRFPPDVLRELLTTSLFFRRFVIEATTVDAAVADLLEIEPGAAILVNERVLETAEGLPIEFGFTRHRGDRSFFYAASTDS
ncbi:MAG TPA: GntR family transcriptional regulator [Mycobacteriales bacterium]|nr:GntR family transcriptional regulator [Mycobacteriales bacterium]